MNIVLQNQLSKLIGVHEATSVLSDQALLGLLRGPISPAERRRNGPYQRLIHEVRPIGNVLSAQLLTSSHQIAKRVDLGTVRLLNWIRVNVAPLMPDQVIHVGLEGRVDRRFSLSIPIPLLVDDVLTVSRRQRFSHDCVRTSTIERI